MNNVESIVEFRGVHKRFGHVIALQDINCRFRSGQITALVGDNGAGKSTLIKIICGVFAPDQGELRFEGKPTVWRSPDEARRAGVETVYQDLALVDSLSISRNFFLGKEPRRYRGLPVLDRAKMNRDALAGVADLGVQLADPDQLVGNLSGGQRKSIAIARSLYFQPKLLILDEPTAALSIKESRSVLEHVQAVKARGISVIFITHNIHLVYPIADQFLLLDQGHKIGEVDKQQVTAENLIEMILTGKSDRRTK